MTLLFADTCRRLLYASTTLSEADIRKDASNSESINYHHQSIRYHFDVTPMGENSGDIIPIFKIVSGEFRENSGDIILIFKIVSAVSPASGCSNPDLLSARFFEQNHYSQLVAPSVLTVSVYVHLRCLLD